MGIATFPSVSSPIKSIQRGEAVAAGNITITSVDTAKTMVNSFSTTAAGTVAATGTLSAASGSTSATSSAAATLTRGMWMNTSATVSGGYGVIPYPAYPTPNYTTNNRYGATPGPYFPGQSYVGDMYMNAFNINGANVSLNATNLSGGSTNLVSAVYGVYVVNSTTIYATGPCRYEVVEYY